MKAPRFVRFLLPVIVLALVTGCSGGDPKFPSKPIQFQVVFPAGGPTDVEARLVAKYAEKHLGQPLVINNVAGAGGAVGWNKVPTMSRDGYNITVYNLPHIVTQPLVEETKFTTKDFVPLVHWGKDPTVFAVRADSKFKTLQDVIAASKASPDSVSVGMAGLWLGHHLAVLQFEDAARVQLKDVPFQGSAPSMQALLGGHVDMISEALSTVLRQGDKVRILAVASEKRDPLAPNAPTFAESGVKGVISSSDRGVAAPKETPDAVVRILREAFQKAVTDPKFQEEMRKSGSEPLIIKGEEVEKLFAQQDKEVRDLLTRLNLLKKK